MTTTPQHDMLLGWAFQHAATLESYRLATGEDIAPALDRYLDWLQENIIGKPGELDDESEAA